MLARIIFNPISCVMGCKVGGKEREGTAFFMKWFLCIKTSSIIFWGTQCSLKSKRTFTYRLFLVWLSSSTGKEDSHEIPQHISYYTSLERGDM